MSTYSTSPASTRPAAWSSQASVVVEDAQEHGQGAEAKPGQHEGPPEEGAASRSLAGAHRAGPLATTLSPAGTGLLLSSTAPFVPLGRGADRPLLADEENAPKGPMRG